MPDGATIFVVEDDTAVQDSLRALLEAANWRVQSFGTGLAFLQAIDGQDRGCVLLDLDLPDLDGAEVIDRLAAMGIDLPVILISGRLDRMTRNRLNDTGVLAVLEKPMRDDLLLETIREALERDQQR